MLLYCSSFFFVKLFLFVFSFPFMSVCHIIFLFYVFCYWVSVYCFANVCLFIFNLLYFYVMSILLSILLSVLLSVTLFLVVWCTSLNLQISTRPTHFANSPLQKNLGERRHVLMGLNHFSNINFASIYNFAFLSRWHLTKWRQILCNRFQNSEIPLWGHWFWVGLGRTCTYSMF